MGERYLRKIHFLNHTPGLHKEPGESSPTTHGSPVALDACRYFAGLLLGALGGRSKEEILSAFYCPGPDRGLWAASCSLARDRRGFPTVLLS
jgi:hypothetical protein